MASIAIPPGLFQQQMPMFPVHNQPQHEQISGLPLEIEQKTQNLILMTGDAGPRRWRKTKTDYLKKLETDNGDLKTHVVELQQQISGLQAQNEILRDQLRYFQSCLSQAAPLVFQPNQEQK
ncbi:hypothetical protein TVAG_205460 [Trichomonas vaginalis G3]|uniref:BZIP domain-containing protein n=1 Tax=Trichomonas vaginalis (strain ATCC PRA-98 / G3) TaxID=412133 RepID=A2FFS5_TRIV3|nr:hypothetical protein TVAGG3_0488840 [Trichomonas vaginalis G3]EAX96259.1 hypothetical protein TVAG_205460 [Trichomonas vaginalis G3]KAI5516232.1 hypothetical protein TVAGG3_0488840 [Trichomonas vaginalis G3]|eukprot:XP_001309189.1 hypothetical protein [Trichomonas vaginalis G3]